MSNTAFKTEDGVTVDIGDVYYYISNGPVGMPKFYATRYESVRDYKKGIIQFANKEKCAWHLLSKELSVSAGIAAETIALAFHKHITVERMEGREQVGVSDETLFRNFLKTIE